MPLNARYYYSISKACSYLPCGVASAGRQNCLDVDDPLQSTDEPMEMRLNTRLFAEQYEDEEEPEDEEYFLQPDAPKGKASK